MTCKVRIEWVTLTAPGTPGAEEGAPNVEYGVQELTTTGSSPEASQPAPYFGLVNGVEVTIGVARVSVIEGAAIVAAGASPMPTESSGYRLVAGGEPQDIPVQSGWFIAIVEAVDTPAIPGISSVTDAAAETSLAAISGEVEADGASNAASKVDLDSLVAGDATAHTDAQAAQTDLVQLHSDLTTANTDAAAGNVTLGQILTEQASVETQAHTDAGAAATLLTAVNTALGSQSTALGGVNTALGLLETHSDAVAGNTTLSAISTALTTLATHADETTANTALAAIQSAVAVSATHSDVSATNTALSAVNSALATLETHTDAAATNTALAGITTALGTLATHADETTANTALAAIQTSVGLSATHSDLSATNTALATVNTALGTLATHGDASAANTTLTAINTALASLATHSDETTANTALAAIQTAVGLLATHADETAANTSLASIATNTGVRGQAVKASSIPVTPPSDPDYRPASGTITAADVATATIAGQSGVTLVTGAPTANSFQTFALNGHSAAALTIVGGFVGTAAIEASGDGGATYAPASGKIRGSALTSASVTAPGLFEVDVTAMTHIRVRATAFTSGPITVTCAASAAPGLSQILNPIRLVDGSGNNATVKPASTQAATTDTALVVAPIAGSTGRDFTANPQALPAIGANFGGSGPYAGYVLVGARAANPARAMIDVENASGEQIVIMRDDGTAIAGAAPANASIFPLGSGATPGSEGGSWSSTTFKGRIQLFAPAALSGSLFVAMFED